MESKFDLRQSNLQLMPWNFQIQYSYLLNRSSASNALSKIYVSAILFTNRCIRRRNIPFLQACKLQIWRPSIANENTHYIIIALYIITTIINKNIFWVVGNRMKLFFFIWSMAMYMSREDWEPINRLNHINLYVKRGLGSH